MRNKSFFWIVFSLLGLWLMLLVERLMGLPALSLLIWLQLAMQLRLRLVLVLSVLVGALVATIFVVPWHWSFLLCWLSAWWMQRVQHAPIQRWWTQLAIAALGSWGIGWIASLRLGQPQPWTWWWPVGWLSLLALLRWRKYV